MKIFFLRDENFKPSGRKNFCAQKRSNISNEPTAAAPPPNPDSRINRAEARQQCTAFPAQIRQTHVSHAARPTLSRIPAPAPAAIPILGEKKQRAPPRNLPHTQGPCHSAARPKTGRTAKTHNRSSPRPCRLTTNAKIPSTQTETRADRRPHARRRPHAGTPTKRA